MKVLILIGILSTFEGATTNEAVAFMSSILKANSFPFRESKTPTSFSLTIPDKNQKVQGEIKGDQLTLFMTNSAIKDTLVLQNLNFKKEKELLSEYIIEFVNSCKDELNGPQDILSLAKEAIVESDISKEITQQSFTDKESEFSFSPKAGGENEEVVVKVIDGSLHVTSSFLHEIFSLNGILKDEFKKQLIELFSDMLRKFPYLKEFSKGDSTIELYEFFSDKLFGETSEVEGESSPLDKLRNIFKDISETVEYDGSNEDLLVLKIGDKSILNYSILENEELRQIKLELKLGSEVSSVEHFPISSTYKQEYLMRLFLAAEVDEYLKLHPKLSEI